MTIKVRAAKMMPINFKARLSAIAPRPPWDGHEKPGRCSGSGLSPPPHRPPSFMKRGSIATCSRCRVLQPRNDCNRLLEPPARAIRHDRGRVMLGLFDAKRDGFDASALRKKRIQKWLWVQARYRGRF